MKKILGAILLPPFVLTYKLLLTALLAVTGIRDALWAGKFSLALKVLLAAALVAVAAVLSEILKPFYRNKDLAPPVAKLFRFAGVRR